jgi:hypothetical protein
VVLVETVVIVVEASTLTVDVAARVYIVGISVSMVVVTEIIVNEV